MRTSAAIPLLCLLFLFPLRVFAEDPLAGRMAGPTDPKAQKTYAEAIAPDKHWQIHDLIDKYRKADKQDGAHCADCALHVARLSLKDGDPKLARAAAMELEGLTTTSKDQAVAHLLHGVAAMRMGISEKKPAYLTEADSEFQKVIALHQEGFEVTILQDGMALANLGQDQAASARFHEYLQTAHPQPVDYRRAKRYEEHPELARQRMAPAFALTTLSGERLSLDELQGKVVLIDFWATWCGPCREALPRIQGIAHKLASPSLVVLSISLDKDEAKWKEFVAKNHMDWQQYRDGGFEGPLAQVFGVRAIPATFTIDTEGVLQDQHVGDSAIEGKLKKLIAEAERNNETRVATNPSGGSH